MDAGATSSAVAKKLASCNRTHRDRAVRLLHAFLSAANPSEEDLLKIWKGLFYCFWHSDKLPVQSELANRLSSLLLSLEFPISSRYFEAFVVTIRREWSGIDHLRMDKFYLLIRRFIHHVFVLLSRNDWDESLLIRFIGVLKEKSFLCADKFMAQGLNYHLTDIFLDEILGVLPVDSKVFVKLLEPFFSVLERTPDKVFSGKIKRGIFSRLLENGFKYLECLKRGGDEVDDEVCKIGRVALGLQISGQLFESASSEQTIQGNRKLLFGLRDGFFKLEKDMESSGIQVPLVTEKVPAEEKPDDRMSKSEEKSPNMSSTKKRKKQKKESASEGKKSKLEDDCAAKNGEADNTISFNDSFMANLQKQFEKVAAESGLGNGVEPSSTPSVMKKKKKKSKSADNKASKPKASPLGAASVKRVRFSLKNNLIWKPHNPLPPQSLRLPPSATPRGSALKKRASPGPIKEMTPPKVRKPKTKVGSVKKAKKTPKSISPAVQRLRKLQSLSV